MATISDSSVSFDETDTRSGEMNSTIEQWLTRLTSDVDDAKASDEFQEWLDVQSRFHDYSYRNTLLIKQQCPNATKVAGYRTWQEEFDRHVDEGENAIWIWAPIIKKQCPECENAPSYHDRIGCEYDKTSPGDWEKGLVGFKPAPVFDVSQTSGEPLPELETAATGEADGLVSALMALGDQWGIETVMVPEDEWSHGEARGVCIYSGGSPRVEVKDRSNDADLATTLVHEFAHARLHSGVREDNERAKREVEAEAVAYVVGRFFGLDTSGSAFYLAVWADEDAETLQERFGRISRTAEKVIATVTG